MVRVLAPDPTLLWWLLSVVPMVLLMGHRHFVSVELACDGYRTRRD